VLIPLFCGGGGRTAGVVVVGIGLGEVGLGEVGVDAGFDEVGVEGAVAGTQPPDGDT